MGWEELRERHGGAERGVGGGSRERVKERGTEGVRRSSLGDVLCFGRMGSNF